MSNLFSTFQLQNIFLYEFHFDVAEAAPKGDANITVTVETSDTTSEEMDGELFVSTGMTVIATLVGQESTDEKSMQLRSSVSVVYRMTPGGENGEDPILAIRMQSLYDGYGFIRDHTMQLASLSPMRRLTLPSIELDSLI